MTAFPILGRTCFNLSFVLYVLKANGKDDGKMFLRFEQNDFLETLLCHFYLNHSSDDDDDKVMNLKYKNK